MTPKTVKAVEPRREVASPVDSGAAAVPEVVVGLEPLVLTGLVKTLSVTDGMGNALISPVEPEFTKVESKTTG